MKPNKNEIMASPAFKLTDASISDDNSPVIINSPIEDI